MNKIFVMIWCIALGSCANKQLIGDKEHYFNVTPPNIFWLQISGLSLDHLGLLNHTDGKLNTKNSFEKMTCSGNIWQHDFFNLRMTASHAFDGQILGTKDTRDRCFVYGDRERVWDKISRPENRNVAILEINPGKGESLSELNKCVGHEFKDEKILIKSLPERITSDRLYKVGKSKKFSAGLHYDSSCKSDRECDSTLKESLEFFQSNLILPSKKNILIVRDFRFARLLKSKKVLDARNYLGEMQSFIGKLKDRFKGLILITGAASRPLELPFSGNAWKNYEKIGTGVLYKRKAIFAPVFAEGNGAEAFCGTYNNSEIAQKLARPFLQD